MLTPAPQKTTYNLDIFSNHFSSNQVGTCSSVSWVFGETSILWDPSSRSRCVLLTRLHRPEPGAEGPILQAPPTQGLVAYAVHSSPSTQRVGGLLRNVADKPHQWDQVGSSQVGSGGSVLKLGGPSSLGILQK